MYIKKISFANNREKFALISILNAYIKKQCTRTDNSKYIIYAKYKKTTLSSGVVYISPVKNMQQEEINDIIKNSIVSQIVSKNTVDKIIKNFSIIESLMRTYD